MEKLFVASLTLVLFASISLIMNFPNDSVSAASFGGVPPGLAEELLKQKSMQEGSNDQTSEGLPQEQTPSFQGEMTVPDQTMQPVQIQKYKVNVRFDQITVHNDHEGALSGDGEYDLKAYVHGILVDLTKLSTFRDAGLTDVSSGETVRFNPGNFMSVNIDSTLPLTIITAGVEDDGCSGPILPSSIQSIIYSAAANESAKMLGAANGTQGAEPSGSGSEKKASGPSTLGSAGAAAGTAVGTAYGGPIGGAIGAAVGDKVGGIVSKGLSSLACKVNPDDKIGTIEESYIFPNYGAGSHTVKSSTGDFTLTYTILAQRIG